MASVNPGRTLLTDHEALPAPVDSLSFRFHFQKALYQEDPLTHVVFGDTADEVAGMPEPTEPLEDGLPYMLRLDFFVTRYASRHA